MKKILYLLDDPSKDKHVHKYVLNGLVAAGFEPTIGYFYGDPKNSVMSGPKIKALGLGLGKKDFRGLNLKAILALRQIIKSHGFKIIHSQRHRALVHCGLSTLGMKDVNLIYTVRATNVLRKVNRRLAIRLIEKNLKRVICVSNAVKEYVRENAKFIPEKKIIVIHNGVSLKKFCIKATQREARRFLGIPENGFYFGIVARLKKAKCHDILLRAFREVTRIYPKTRLAIVGDGPLEKGLKVLSDELGISQKVFFTGRVEYDEVPLAMKAFDCFVHPSFREALGVSILEAMASKLPVITTSADGIKDIFKLFEKRGQERIGKMVSPKNVHELSRAMLEFRTLSQDELKRVGEIAREHVKRHFSKELMVEKTVSVYRNLLYA